MEQLAAKLVAIAILIVSQAFSSSVSGLADALRDNATSIAQTAQVAYIGNGNSYVFHELNCKSVSKMKESNKVDLYSRKEAIEKGYRPCGNCKP